MRHLIEGGAYSSEYSKLQPDGPLGKYDDFLLWHKSIRSYSKIDQHPIIPS